MSFAPLELESAIARVEALPDERARTAARDAIAAVLALHREGLRRLTASLADHPALRDAARDDVIGSLLLLHELHPLSFEERVRAAVDRAGAAEILSLTPSLVRVRVRGDDHAVRATHRLLIEAAPEVEKIEVVAADPSIIPFTHLAKKKKSEVASPHERCDLCAEGVGADHDHLFDIHARRLRCACAACAILFDGSNRKMKRVHRHARKLTDLVMSETRWAALQVPVGVAFFSRSTSLDRVIAAYPGPAGAVESEVEPEAWDALVAENDALARLEPDTSALLIDRVSKTRSAWIVSIDECFRLTGLVRARWQGIHGGDAPIAALAEFFATLTEAS